MKLLRDLNPRFASALFFVALVAGVVLILWPWGSLLAWVVLPLLPVLLYSVALYVSQTKFLVSHSAAVKSSPYILGFTLTLAALFNLFWRGGADLVDGTIDQDLFLGQIGAAIATTAVGLIARQVLFTHDAVEEDQDRIFRSLASELRRNAKDFDLAQRQLVSLLKEFVATREQLFSLEEQAHQRFLSGLESGSQILTEIETKYPNRLRSALQTIGTHVTALDETVTEAARNLTELSTSAKEGNKEIRTSASALLTALAEDSRKWGEVSRAARDGLDGSTSAVRVREEAVKSTLDGMQISMSAARKNHDELAAEFSRLLTDVRAMDQVIDEVASLLSKRVAGLKNE